MNTNCQPPNCPCFCPSAANPAPVLLQQGGPAAVIVVPIYGTQPFQVSILTNPTLPVTGLPLIATAQLFNGNELTITTNVPALTETEGPYVATLQVCNPCGTVTVQIQVDVVANLNPVVTNCALAQTLWTPEAREPTVGDTLLAFTPAGCRALLPPTVDVCAELMAFPGAAPQLIDTVFGEQGGACVEFTILDVLALVDTCAALNGFAAGAPLVAGDRFVIMQGAACVTTTLAEVTAAVDVCALLQNLPNAVVQPTAVFYGQQAGQCFEFAVADLLALAAPACPLEATCDGSCAAPAYSFASQPASGMWMNGAILTLSANNCADFIEIGASVNVRSLSSDVNVEAGHATPGSGARINLFGHAGSGIVSITGAASTAVLAAGLVFISGGIGNSGFDGADVIISGGNSSVGVGGTVQINAGSGPLSGGNVVVTGAGSPGTFLVQGFDILTLTDLLAGRVIIDSGRVRIDTSSTVRWRWETNGSVNIGGSAGGVGQVITSNGAGLPPTWQTLPAPVVAFPLLAPNGSCAAPSYSFTSSPDSGVFYDPAGVGSVIIGDDNCADFISVGASILLQTTSTGITANAGGTFTAQAGASGAGAFVFAASSGAANGGRLSLLNAIAQTGGAAAIAGGNGAAPDGSGGVANVLAGSGRGAGVGADAAVRGGDHLTTGAAGNASMFAGSAFGAGTGGQTTIGGGNTSGGAAGEVTLIAGADFVGGGSAGVSILTGPGQTGRVRWLPDGEWNVGGSVGAAGEVITSNGVGTPPSWQAVSPSFPLLAPDGSCAAPSYSFTSSPDSGMFYTGTAVRIGDDNCADYIEIGASINIVSSVSTVFATGGGNGTVFGGTLLLEAGAGVTPGDAVLSGGFNSAGIGGDTVLQGGGGPVNFGAVRLQSGGGSLQDQLVVEFGVNRLLVGTRMEVDGGTQFIGQTNGAGAAVGTLTNAPSAGNPAFWLPVFINGVQRFIPAWA